MVLLALDCSVCLLMFCAQTVVLCRNTSPPLQFHCAAGLQCLPCWFCVHRAAPVLLLPAKPWLAGMQILPEERRDIPHHVLDILEPSQEFSAGVFFEAGRAATQAILQVSSITAYRLELCAVPCEYFQRLCAVLQRGNVPIVVGGTGLYLRWFVHGRPSTPRSDDAMAAAAQAVLDQVGAHRLTAQAASMLRLKAVIGAASGYSFIEVAECHA